MPRAWRTGPPRRRPILEAILAIVAVQVAEARLIASDGIRPVRSTSSKAPTRADRSLGQIRVPGIGGESRSRIWSEVSRDQASSVDELEWSYRPTFFPIDVPGGLVDRRRAPEDEPSRVEEEQSDGAIRRTQFDPIAPPPSDEPDFPGGLSSVVTDPPISYSGPPPENIEDVKYRDGPRIPEPMVFDLVRGLGARRGELEFNVLNLVPFRRGLPRYEWAPEVEYALADGFAIEYEMPIFDNQIVAHKFGAQYTFGTALDDSFIHGAQFIGFYDSINGEFAPTLLYLAGLRLDKTWSLFGMFGGSVGPQVFPFSDELPRTGTDLIVNLSLFANVTDRLVLGVETNLARQLRGPSEFLFMPQLHYQLRESLKVQFGMGMRDDVEGRHGELGFRVIFER